MAQQAGRGRGLRADSVVHPAQPLGLQRRGCVGQHRGHGLGAVLLRRSAVPRSAATDRIVLVGADPRDVADPADAGSAVPDLPGECSSEAVRPSMGGRLCGLLCVADMGAFLCAGVADGQRDTGQRGDVGHDIDRARDCDSRLEQAVSAVGAGRRHLHCTCRSWSPSVWASTALRCSCCTSRSSHGKRCSACRTRSVAFSNGHRVSRPSAPRPPSQSRSADS